MHQISELNLNKGQAQLNFVALLMSIAPNVNTEVVCFAENYLSFVVERRGRKGSNTRLVLA